IVVALPRVTPIAEPHAAVRPVLNRESSEPGIVRQQEVLRMMGHVAGAAPLEDIVVDPITVKVAGEQSIAITRRPVVAQVDHGPDMGVAAAGYVVRPLAATRFGPVSAAPMEVVGTALQQPVTVGIAILPIHPL